MGSSTGDRIRITVHLHTLLRKKTNSGWQGVFQLDVDRGSRLSDIIQALALDFDAEHTLLVVNGQHAQAEMILTEGDEVHFIPAISGGGR